MRTKLKPRVKYFEVYNNAFAVQRQKLQTEQAFDPSGFPPSRPEKGRECTSTSTSALSSCT